MASVDRRSTLVAALRARFGNTDEGAQADGGAFKRSGAAPDFNSNDLALMPPKEEDAPDDSIAYLSDFLFAHTQDPGALLGTEPQTGDVTGDPIADAFTQMDRGLDARQKVIDALKVQISRSTPETPLGVETAPIEIIDLDSEPPGGSLAPPAMQPVATSGLTPEGMAPPSKRMRLEPTGAAPGFAPLSHPIHTTPPPPLNPLAGPGVPLAPVSVPSAPPLVPPLKTVPPMPPGPPPDSAEAAELAAQKAKMLQRLQAVQDVAGASHTVPPKSPPPASGASQLQQSSLPTPGSGPAPAPPDAAGCPPGSSAEEYEAYRRRCWQQYYEYQAVWKKYYMQNQAEQSGKGKVKGKVQGKAGLDASQTACVELALPGKGSLAVGLGAAPNIGGKGAPLSVASGGKGGQVQPGGPPGSATSGNLAIAAANLLASAKGGQAARVVPPPRQAEEDIHSKLLGL